MQWLKVTVATTTEGSEIVSAHLMEAGSSGTMIEDKRDVQTHQRPAGQWDIIDENILKNMSDDVLVTGYYSVDARAGDALPDIRARMEHIRGLNLPFDLGALTVAVQSVDEEDWAEYWKKEYVPIRLGKHMLIRPSWMEAEVLPGDKVIQIDPGMAFGTGTHETTGLCTCLVEEYVSPGDKVIDIGTGTGILAIAAAHCGAQDVLAVDIDPVAVRVAAQNVRDNGFTGTIRVLAGDLFQAVDEVADVVIMNIIADVIIPVVGQVRNHIRQGGAFIASGIARERVGEVVKALTDADYQSLDVRELGEWAAIACRRDA